MTTISILEAVNTTSVQFHGQPIITAMAAGVAYVAMKPIVENLGMSWSTQTRKLLSQIDKYGYAHMNIPSKGGIQQMLCIPLRKLNGWLFSINPAKVRADIRDKLIAYQEECFTVLHDYWATGIAVKKPRTTTDERTPLRDAVNMLVSKRHMMYPEAYGLIHRHFNVTSIEQLEPNQLAPAVEFVHQTILEGEWLEKEAGQLKLPITYPMDVFGSVGSGEYGELSRPWRYPAKKLIPNGDNPNPLGRMLHELKQLGCEVEGAKFQLLSLQHHVENLLSKISMMERILIK